MVKVYSCAYGWRDCDALGQVISRSNQVALQEAEALALEEYERVDFENMEPVDNDVVTYGPSVFLVDDSSAKTVESNELAHGMDIDQLAEFEAVLDGTLEFMVL